MRSRRSRKTTLGTRKIVRSCGRPTNCLDWVPTQHIGLGKHWTCLIPKTCRESNGRRLAKELEEEDNDFSSRCCAVGKRRSTVCGPPSVRFSLKLRIFPSAYDHPFHKKMSKAPGAPRQPLGEVWPNTRSRVVAGRDWGHKWIDIGAREGLGESTCRQIFKNAQHQTSCITQPKGRKPLLLTERDRRVIFRTIALEPKITAAQLVATTVLHVKKKTIYRFLKKSGIQKWRATKRPLLDDEKAAKRLD
jgi:hypothetical protein